MVGVVGRGSGAASTDPVFPSFTGFAAQSMASAVTGGGRMGRHAGAIGWFGRVRGSRARIGP